MSTTSSSTSTLNSVLSALGGSNGIDVTAAVNSVLYADRAPERVWQAQQATLTSQTTAIDQINGQASTVQDDLATLQDAAGALTSTSATTSDSAVLTATATPGTAASNHTVVINSLATTASWYSSTVATSSTPLTAGTIDITVGSTATPITIGSGVNTLDQLAASINTQSLGVTASVVTDSSGARLSLVANSTGAASAFSVSSGAGLTFQNPLPGADASLTVDGVPLTSTSNTVTGAIGGVTLNLQNASPGESVKVSLAPDTSSIVNAVNQFVNDYNTLVTNVNSQFAYNSATNTAGVLQNDSAIQGLQSALLDSTNYNSGSSTDNTLQSLGISVNSDGTLTLNSSTLSSAVQSNSSAVTSFFQGTSINGFAASLNSALTTYTDPTEGAFTVDLSSITNEYTDLSNQTATLERYLSSQQTILTAQYNQADILLQQLPNEIKQTQAILNPNEYNSNNG
jgi:flagellar hook-associated protein 2